MLVYKTTKKSYKTIRIDPIVIFTLIKMSAKNNKDFVFSAYDLN